MCVERATTVPRHTVSQSVSQTDGRVQTVLREQEIWTYAYNLIQVPEEWCEISHKGEPSVTDS